MDMKRTRIFVALAAMVVAVAEAHDGHAVEGPASAFAFPLPEPGSYRLPPIKAAAGGTVLLEDGVAADLTALLRDRITVFSFIYTRCPDLCPVATLRLADLHELAAAERTVAERLQLVSLSFDPAHDTPEVMAEYGLIWRTPQVEHPVWHFVTAPDDAQLAPVLADYDQAVARLPVAGEPEPGLAHVLRVYLVDAGGMVRNIYSLDYLDPRLVLGDVRTLLLEERGGARHLSLTGGTNLPPVGMGYAAISGPDETP
jgi:protein SCO1